MTAQAWKVPSGMKRERQSGEVLGGGGGDKEQHWRLIEYIRCRTGGCEEKMPWLAEC